jgi:hypothetical protein
MESIEERATTTATERTEEQWAPASTDILSQLWDNITEAKKAVKIWILDRGESWAPSNHTNRIRLQLHCLISTCTFYIRVAQKKRGGLFTVTSYSPHNCPPSTHANFKPRNAAWYIASCLERDITINRQIKPKEIQERGGIYHQLQQLPYTPAWRARERLRNTLDGDEGASFNLIPAWILRLKEDDTAGSPSYIELKTTIGGRFEALFVMIGSVRSTLNTLRPFYALDGTHTRSRYNLTLLIAVGIDAEDQILPLAFALVPVENEEWWIWFCQHLALAFGEFPYPQYVVISDRDKGLLNAVESELPGARHALCCQHLSENVYKRFGKEYKSTFWQIARAQSELAFEGATRALERDAPDLMQYLSAIGYENFANFCFRYPRWGHDTSNIVESTNSMWREIRELPPLQLLNGIYQWYTKAFFERSHLPLAPGNSILSNMAYRDYKHRESAARGFRVLPSSDTDFLVTSSGGAEYIVTLPKTDELEILEKLVLGRCSCGKYQENTAPCSHAIACIQYIGGDPYSYFYPFHKRVCYQETYIFPVRPVTLQDLEIVEDSQILPPIKRAKRGRPKVARIRANYRRDRAEGAKKRVYSCSVCHQEGHNRRVCPNQPVEHGRAQKARDQEIIDSDEGK